MTPDFKRGVEAAPKHNHGCSEDACRGECLWPWCLECGGTGRIDPSAPTPDPAAVSEVVPLTSQPAIDAMRAVLVKEYIASPKSPHPYEDDGFDDVLREAVAAGLATVRADLAAPDDPTLDATDGAHPAWWRGHEHGAEAMRRGLAKRLGADEATPWQRLLEQAAPDLAALLPPRTTADLGGLEDEARSLISGEFRASGFAVEDVGERCLAHVARLRAEMGRLAQVRENFADLIYGRIEIRAGKAVVVDCHGKASECFRPVDVAAPPADLAALRAAVQHIDSGDDADRYWIQRTREVVRAARALVATPPAATAGDAVPAWDRCMLAHGASVSFCPCHACRDAVRAHEARTPVPQEPAEAGRCATCEWLSCICWVTTDEEGGR